MNKDKIIKDLKERNDKLSNQYRLRDIRCVHLEMENADLQQRIDNAKRYCEEQKTKMYKSRNKIALFVLMKLEKILNRTIGE